jgi:capsular exopolysaccharide synthesis family protein
MTETRQPVRPTPDGAHLLDYIRVLLKRLWLIVGVFILVVGVVGVATWKATPYYRATATINIRPPNLVWGQIDPMAAVHTVNQSQLYMNTQYALLKQTSTIQEMAETEDLESLPQFVAQGLTNHDIVKRIRGNVTVAPQKETTLVQVSVSYPDHKDPELRVVARIANSLVETFQTLQIREAQGALQEKRDALENSLIEYRMRVQKEGTELTKLMERHNTDRDTFLERLDSARGRFRDMQNQQDTAEAELSRLRPRYERIVAAIGKDGKTEDESGLEEIYAESFVLEDVSIQEQMKSIRQIQRDLLDLQRVKGYGSDNPEVRALEKQISDRQDALDFDKRRLVLSEKSSFEDLELFRNDVRQRREKAESDFRELSLIKRDYDQMTDRMAEYQAEHDRYFAVYEKIAAAQGREIKPVQIVQLASNPVAPYSPDVQLNMILAIVFGLLAGMGLAFFLEYMDDTVKTKEELQRITDVPLFGVIPNISARKGEVQKKDLYAYNQPKSTISEAFRGIRTAISYSSQRKENRVYLVTSSGPKEGKSTIAINVATVMAYSGTRTVLIDADLRRPRVHKSFDLNNTRGLTNVIIGDVKVQDAVQPTAVENLFVLPSGPIPPNPSELLGRERMLEVLEELRQYYDRILLDTPPIGAVTDAAVLGRIVDSVILVVHAGRTRKKLIERGLEQLSQIDVDVSGIVLNNLRIGRKRYYPGYYHYYYYSSYYGADDKPRPQPKDAKKV